MTYELCRAIFLGALIACGLMFVLACVLFFVLKIPKVIGDLSGSTARKAIEDIRKQNEQSGDKTYKSSAVNLQRGRVTDKMTPSGRISKPQDSPFGTGVITEQLAAPAMTGPANETTVLNTANETTVLNTMEETTVLYQSASETTVLSAPAAPAPVAAPVQTFQIEYEITFIHTNEVIA